MPTGRKTPTATHHSSQGEEDGRGEGVVSAGDVREEGRKGGVRGERGRLEERGGRVVRGGERGATRGEGREGRRGRGVRGERGRLEERGGGS